VCCTISPAPDIILDVWWSKVVGEPWTEDTLVLITVGGPPPGASRHIEDYSLVYGRMSSMLEGPSYEPDTSCAVKHMRM
jgi:hypothetical protein